MISTTVFAPEAIVHIKVSRVTPLSPTFVVFTILIKSCSKGGGGSFYVMISIKGLFRLDATALFWRRKTRRAGFGTHVS